MPGPIDYTKIQIIPDPESQGWWDGTKQHKLLVRQCNDCGHKFFPPWPRCQHCRSANLGWFETSGKGFIHTFIVPVQPILAAFANSVPYVVALVELPDCHNADGSVCRIGGVMIDDEDAVGIGLPVEVVWDNTAQEDIEMPRWKVSGTAENVWKFTN